MVNATTTTTTLIHFNDIYNIEKAAKFVFQVDKARQEAEANGDQCFAIFSGDAFSPSIISTITRGKHMIPILNALKIDCACLGNHELDFGIREFKVLRKECNFPWICSNARFITDDEPLGGCEEYVVLEKEGGKILVLGLVESEWMGSLSATQPHEIEFEEYCDYVKRRVPEIQQEKGPFDFVVAASHMRIYNDYKLADQCAGLIDIVLGGHDHHYENTVRNGVRILNSGTDFSDFTSIQVRGKEETSASIKPLLTEATRVTISHDSPEDPEVAAAVDEARSLVEVNTAKVIGKTKIPLDARFSEIRTKETNISNFLAAIMARATDADVAILNAGTIRADRVIPKGTLKLRDLCDLLPMPDPIAVVELTGEKLLQILESGVSKYPATEGRFPCVDGVRFAFDPSKPSGSRIVDGSVCVRSSSADDPFLSLRRRGQTAEEPDSKHEMKVVTPEFAPLNLNKSYKVCSTTYLLEGKDGYDAFVGAPVVREDEDCPLLLTAVSNVFTEMSVLQRWVGFTTQGAVVKAASAFKRVVRSSTVDPFAICPVVDGRIRNILEEKAQG
jgi:5'-nucleotidase